MKKQLFPKEFLEHSVEVHQFNYSKHSRRIYWAIILFLLLLCVVLPLIEVNVYTTVRGVIKPDQERLLLRVNTTGQVVTSQLFPNATITKGDTLLRLAQPVVDEKKRLLVTQMDEHQHFLDDLTQLLTKKKRPKLKTATYQKQWQAFIAKSNEISLRKEKLKHDLNRAQSLFNNGIIPRIEWEDAQHAYALVLVDEEQFLRQSLTQWETERIDYEKQKRTLKSNWEQLQQQQQMPV